MLRDKKTESDEITVRRILEARLYEAGPVTFPAYETTEVLMRALAARGSSPAERTLRAIEEWRREHEEVWRAERDRLRSETDLIAL